jgi:hypothetical protein
MADDAQIARGEYLVTIGGYNDFHTPGYFFGNPDMSRFLGARMWALKFLVPDSYFCVVAER